MYTCCCRPCLSRATFLSQAFPGAFSMITRRQFMLGSLAFGGLASSAFGKSQLSKAIASAMPVSTGYGNLIKDKNSLLDLPEGFSYRVISAFGDAMSDGLHVPDRADGMG
jgi:secreted PhoX family phosphatase